MGAVTGAWRRILALLLLVPITVVSCGRAAAPPPSESAASSAPAAPPVKLSITPSDGAKEAPLSSEVGIELTGGQINEVSLVTAGGKAVSGRMRADGTAWVPDRPLQPNTGYRATVTATAPDGQTSRAETCFTTMAAPSKRTETGLYLMDGQEYGVAMPVVVEFVQPVPESARASVQRRMFVATEPPQPGVWHWHPSGRAAYYRAPEYWQPGTKIHVRIALDGHPTGEGRYGDQDRSASATIGSRLAIEVDNATKQMTVTGDGVQTRRLPVSLGKPSTPTSSGHMVVMSREEQTVFDTYAELGPVEGYRADISYAMRLTWGGEYIHAAPWSEGDQGVRNVSHGCINLSMADARWLFGHVKVGDPVKIKGTEVRLEHGNGWTAWDLTWEEFVAGSALPVPDDLALAAAATAVSTT